MHKTTTTLAIFSLMVLWSCSKRLEIVEADLAFVGANVIPMTKETVLEDYSVFVSDGVIVYVGPAAAHVAAESAKVIDARGKYLIPGLADMHVHIWSDTDLPLFVANGVTLVRNMWGEPETLAMRDRVARGVIVGPRIVTAGRVVDGDPPIWGEYSAVAKSQEDARGLMDQQQAAGYDSLKTYNGLSREVFDAIASYSRETGFPFGGHVPDEVPLEHALRSGIRHIEHLSGWSAAIRRAGGPYKTRAELPDRAKRSANRVAVAHGIQSGELNWNDVFDDIVATELAGIASENTVWQVPTLTVLKRISTSRRQARTEFDRPEMRYISPESRASWNPETDFRLKDSTDEQLESRQAFFEYDLALVNLLHEAGVPLMIGTDTPNPFVLFGFSIHEELEHFVDAGLTAYEALDAATRAPAEFLGELDSSGTVEIGKRADLVLLHANPLENISATRAIVGIVQRGHWRPKPELDEMLENIAAGYAIPDNWFEGLDFLGGNGAAMSYTRTYNNTETGAERYMTVTGATNRTVLAQHRSKSSGELTLESYESEFGDDGALLNMRFALERPSAKANAVAKTRSSVIELSGYSLDGSEVSQAVNIKSDAILVCELIACVTPIISKLESLGVGESTQIDTVFFETFGGVRLEPETWTLTRSEDKNDTRVYEGVIERRSEKSEVRLIVDAQGVRSKRIVTMMGIVEVTRTTQ